MCLFFDCHLGAGYFPSIGVRRAFYFDHNDFNDLLLSRVSHCNSFMQIMLVLVSVHDRFPILLLVTNTYTFCLTLFSRFLVVRFRRQGPCKVV